MTCPECGEFPIASDSDGRCYTCRSLWIAEGWEDALERLTPPSNRAIEDLEPDVINPTREK